MQHEEDYLSESSQNEQYYEGYADLGVHRVMLADRPRMQFYKRILHDPAVVGGKVVVDVGSGTGVLSAWAAQAGAARVLSIEASSLAELQPRMFEDNGLSALVTVLHTTVEAMVETGAAAFVAAHASSLPLGGISLIVSEWMGFYLVHEAMLPSVLLARDFFSDVNALLGVTTPVELVPSSARLLAAPVSLEPLYTASFRSFWGGVDGVAMDVFGRAAFDQTMNSASPLIEAVPAECLLVRPDSVAVLWESNMSALRVQDLVEMGGTAHFRLSAPAALNDEQRKAISVDGFALWFEVRHGDVVLDTAPSAEATHWKQTTVLLPQEARRSRLITLGAVGDDTLDVRFTLRTSEPGRRFYTLEFELC